MRIYYVTIGFHFRNKFVELFWIFGVVVVFFCHDIHVVVIFELVLDTVVSGSGTKMHCSSYIFVGVRTQLTTRMFLFQFAMNTWSVVVTNRQKHLCILDVACQWKCQYIGWSLNWVFTKLINWIELTIWCYHKSYTHTAKKQWFKMNVRNWRGHSCFVLTDNDARLSHWNQRSVSEMNNNIHWSHKTNHCRRPPFGAPRVVRNVLQAQQRNRWE